MKYIKSLLVDNIGLPYLEQFWHEIKVEIFHTDTPDTLKVIYTIGKYEDGRVIKGDWFDKDNIVAGMPAMEYLKTKNHFNRFKLSFKTHELDYWSDTKGNGFVEYSFLLQTDRVTCNSIEEVKAHIWGLKKKYVEKYQILKGLTVDENDVTNFKE